MAVTYRNLARSNIFIIIWFNFIFLHYIKVAIITFFIVIYIKKITHICNVRDKYHKCIAICEPNITSGSCRKLFYYWGGWLAENDGKINQLDLWNLTDYYFISSLISYSFPLSITVCNNNQTSWMWNNLYNHISDSNDFKQMMETI